MRELVALLEKRFPLLEFSCWSTEQVASYGHLQLARFVAFVHTERDAMESVTEALRDAGWSAWLNPTQQEAGVAVPTVNSPLGDKLTAFAPRTNSSPRKRILSW